MNSSKVSISRSNSKLGAAIPSFSLPPVVTCRPGAPCIRDCYACKMCRLRSSVGAAWARNLEIWKASPDAVRYAILSEALMSSYFRYFVGGDIPDPEFFLMMVDVANAAPRCEFLAFTKKFEIVNDFLNAGGVIPSNLHVILASGATIYAPKIRIICRFRALFITRTNYQSARRFAGVIAASAFVAGLLVGI